MLVVLLLGAATQRSVRSLLQQITVGCRTAIVHARLAHDVSFPKRRGVQAGVAWVAMPAPPSLLSSLSSPPTHPPHVLPSIMYHNHRRECCQMAQGAASCHTQVQDCLITYHFVRNNPLD